MLEWVLGRKKGKKKPKPGRRKKPSYDEAKRIAAKGNAKERAEIAEIEDLEPEFLYLFATDKDPSVRRAVARNDGSPLQADVILAKDVDDQVREDLAYKIGRLVPTLTESENERLTEMTFEVLEILAQDQLPQVRAIIAEEIKLLDHVPPKIIKQLAHDAHATVAVPILEYSQLLNDEQLLQIISGGIRGGALKAVARRKNLSGKVSKAIVDQDDDPATAELLKNETANINEKLILEIAGRAETRPSLHLPLVDRRALSKATLRRIANFVSSSLVDRMISKNDLDDDLAKEIRLAVRERIEAGETEDDDSKQGAERAKKLHAKGKLDEYAMLDAIDDDDMGFLTQAYVLLADLKEKQVTKMLESKSAKGYCALTWKAGLSAELAVSLQRRIGKIPAKSMIKEGPEGSFQMAEEELKWYVDYFKD